jgi:uncharacterized membrane-anchored protein YhcB (DUF1043 family)
VYSLNIVLMSGGVLLLVGLGLGALLGRSMSAQGQKNRELENRLDLALRDKEAYEDEVHEHFSNTAGLLNSLTESYREVHNHLAMGAATLCQDIGPISLEKISAGPPGDEIPANLADIQAPLDYAPKSSPNETGMLNEEFGLERVKPESIAIDEPSRH